jgi:hypothetical protein
MAPEEGGSLGEAPRPEAPPPSRAGRGRVVARLWQESFLQPPAQNPPRSTRGTRSGRRLPLPGFREQLARSVFWQFLTGGRGHL